MNANKRLYSILDTFLSVVVMDQSKQTDDFVSILLDIYYQKNVLVVPFTMDESETFAAMRSWRT